MVEAFKVTYGKGAVYHDQDNPGLWKMTKWRRGIELMIQPYRKYRNREDAASGVADGCRCGAHRMNPDKPVEEKYVFAKRDEEIISGMLRPQLIVYEKALERFDKDWQEANLHG